MIHRRYKRDRSRQAPPQVKLQVYIREDQQEWLALEAADRSDKKRGRNGAISGIVREAIDLMIEYVRHQEFLAGKVRPPKGQFDPLRSKLREGKATRGWQPPLPAKAASE